MILSYVIFTLPFIMWVLTSFFNDLPVKIMRSAAVDGATTFQTFYIEYDSQDHIYDKE